MAAVASRSAAQLKHTTGTESPPPEATRVLVVDDSPLQLKAMEKMLTSMGFQVQCVSSGKEALEVLRGGAEKPQVVVADVEMPKMRGPELLVKVRSDPALIGIPVILMSAVDTSPESVESAYGKGGQDYLFKPVGKKTLQKKIRDVIDAARVRQSVEKYASRFEQERAEVEKLRKQLSEISQAKMSAIATPLHTASKRLHDVIDSGELGEERTKELKEVLSTLNTTSNLHKPEFARYLNSSQFKEVFSEVTASWLTQYIEAEERNEDAVIRDKRSSAQSDTAEVAALMSWDYECTELETPELLDGIIRMFRYFELFTKFKIEREAFGVFLANLQKSYHNNPYHNFRHAFDVTQTTFSLLVAYDAQRFLTDLDVLGLLMSALCHDADHPGNNNAFQIATRSPLAMLYNDQSVLENHHCAVAFEILHDVKGANVFANLDDEQYTQVRKIMIHCILATDMAKHFEITTKFQTRMESGTFPDVKSFDDRLDVMCLVIKAADISNVAKKPRTAKWWNGSVAREFFGTGDELKQLGLPVAPHLDREKTSEEKVTVSFIDFVARGFFASFSKLLDDQHAGELMANVDANRALLVKDVKEGEAK